MYKTVIVLALLLFVSSGCSKADNAEVIRESAWKSLSADDKKEVQANWKEAVVEATNVNEMPIPKGGGKRTETANLYKVSFESDKDRISGPILVFVDGDTNKPVGYSKTVNPWNYEEGYVVAKEDSRVLIVRDKVDFELSLSKILKSAQPDAIWFTVEKANYDAVAIGDHVKATVAGGMINLSYPAQGKADGINKID
ncbi:YobA family protein [Paenibacillus glycanilyticus]|uniref:DUF3221 domain-containing protein n=1 Tax=Paenibacillus glycanilyticus TaxID=126569 RepID=UPI0020401BA5|nr:DUF3221 domain-containing protein [Paenibacillus glycanilyticus]MCM3628479.1 YobA family protein [Paenibacillus glycanilyticus]